MAHSDVTKNDITKTSKEKILNYLRQVSYLEVGIKASKTLKTVHRYDFFVPELKSVFPPELKFSILFFVKAMSLWFFFSFFFS